MHAKIVLAAHITVHHKLHRERGLLAGIECHRTDDGRRRSTPLNHFNVGLLRKLQWPIADIGHFKLRFNGTPQCQIT